jgi:hypothetical protein
MGHHSSKRWEWQHVGEEVLPIFLFFWHLLHPQSYNNLITSKGKDEVVT